MPGTSATSAPAPATGRNALYEEVPLSASTMRHLRAMQETIVTPKSHLSEFAPFEKLPQELKDAVWKYYLVDRPRIVRIGATKPAATITSNPASIPSSNRLSLAELNDDRVSVVRSNEDEATEPLTTATSSPASTSPSTRLSLAKFNETRVSVAVFNQSIIHNSLYTRHVWKDHAPTSTISICPQTDMFELSTDGNPYLDREELILSIVERFEEHQMLDKVKCLMVNAVDADWIIGVAVHANYFKSLELLVIDMSGMVQEGESYLSSDYILLGDQLENHPFRGRWRLQHTMAREPGGPVPRVEFVVRRN